MIRIQIPRYFVCDMKLLCTVMQQITKCDMWENLHSKLQYYLEKHDADFIKRDLRKDPLHMVNLESVRVHLEPAEIYSVIKASDQIAAETGASKWNRLSDHLRTYLNP